MIAAVVGAGGIIAEGVLASKFVCDGVKDLLDLAAPSDKVFSQQKGAPAAVVGQRAQDIHIEFIALALRCGFTGEQCRESQGDTNRIGTLRVRQGRNTDGVDEQFGFSNLLQNVIQLGGARLVLSVGYSENRRL